MGQTHDVHVYFPKAVFLKLKKMADTNRRSVSAEVVIAVEKRLERLQAEKDYNRGKR